MSMTAHSRRGFLTRMMVMPLLASAPIGASAQVGRNYRIELVIFERLGYESRNFIENVARPLEPELSGFGIGEGPIRPSRYGFDLEHVVERIERSGQGRVLARIAWDQVGRDFRSTPWVRVQEGRYLGARHVVPGPPGESPGPGLWSLSPEQERYELEGRLRVWVGQFLHLETELIFHASAATAGEAAQTPSAIPVRGRQRMASGSDLFYLDHPVVGIIARATRVTS
jgi:hypothetical protein